MIGSLILAVALLQAGPGSVQPVLAFPEPGVDDSAAYQGYQTRFYRDSRGNTVQVYLEPRGGRAVLLLGHSTAGKSTLCYACVRDGFQLLAEDVIYVSLNDGLRMWGNSRHIHLLPDAPRHFGELAGVPPRVQANGKLKLAVDVAALGADRLRHAAERAIVCVLRRGDGPASAVEPVEPEVVLDALRGGREPGFDLFQDVEDVAAALVRGGTYFLTVGSDLPGAVALLRRLAGGGGAG